MRSTNSNKANNLNSERIKLNRLHFDTLAWKASQSIFVKDEMGQQLYSNNSTSKICKKRLNDVILKYKTNDIFTLFQNKY